MSKPDKEGDISELCQTRLRPMTAIARGYRFTGKKMLKATKIAIKAIDERRTSSRRLP